MLTGGVSQDRLRVRSPHSLSLAPDSRLTSSAHRTTFSGVAYGSNRLMQGQIRQILTVRAAMSLPYRLRKLTHCSRFLFLTVARLLRDVPQGPHRDSL
jgi:hypothetical protein